MYSTCANKKQVTDIQAQTSDDSIYQKYRYIVFDVDISYRIVEKIANFLIYHDIIYISQYFRYITIVYARSLYFYYCTAEITRINGAKDKLTKAVSATLMTVYS